MPPITKKAAKKVSRKTVTKVNKKAVAKNAVKKTAKKVAAPPKLTFIIDLLSDDSLPLKFHGSGKTKEGITVTLAKREPGDDQDQVIRVRGPVFPPKPGKPWKNIEFIFHLKETDLK